jgi:hypothetical protein
MAELEDPKRPRNSSHDVLTRKNSDVDNTERSQGPNPTSSPARFIDARSRQDEVTTKNSRSTAISSPFRLPLTFPSHDVDTEPTIDITDNTVGGHHLYSGLPSHSVQWELGLYHSPGESSESLLLKRFPRETASRTPVQQPRFRKHAPVPATVLFARDAAPLHLPKLDKYLSSFPPPRLSQDVDHKVPFPPMGNLAKLGLSLDDLETNRTKIPAWRNRNNILGSAVNIVLGVMVCSD